MYDRYWARTNRACPFEEYRAILTAIYQLAGGAPMIDLGCGEAHVTKNFDGVLVDLVPRPNPRIPVVKDDIRNAPERFKDRSFNLLIMTDSIEHLTVGDAQNLLGGMYRLCGAAVVFTPVGPWRLNVEATDPDSHKSAWYPEQFREEGWQVWEWPSFHRFEGGEILGAFWAWKFKSRANPTEHEVAAKAGVSL